MGQKSSRQPPPAPEAAAVNAQKKTPQPAPLSGLPSEPQSELPAPPLGREAQEEAAPRKARHFSTVVGVAVHVQRVQRFIRRVLAFRRELRATNWIIYNALDQFGEKETIRISRFITCCLIALTTENAGPPRGSRSLALQHLGGTSQTPLMDADVDPLATSHLVVVESSKKMLAKSTFKLPAGPVTTETAQLVIELCRHGGRLGMNCLLRLLRLVFKCVKDAPNITRIRLPAAGRITVVGDLHGQLSDLLHILDNAGQPSLDSHFLVFNGDVVDRGPESIECITIIFVLFCAYPGSVAINRGNHEDHRINAMYGFERECDEKYPWVHAGESSPFTSKVFGEVFKSLPLFTLINDRIFIVHGGLFSDPIGATLSVLDEIPRHEYVCATNSNYKDRRDYLFQLMTEALWSDPDVNIMGLAQSTRGTGWLFGPDIASKWMETNKIDMTIRSHYCVDEGFALPFFPEHSLSSSIPPPPPFLCTVFSASNYTGSCHNKGAYVEICHHPFSTSTPVSLDSGLHFRVARFRAVTKSPAASSVCLEKNNRATLQNVLIRLRSPLLAQFQASDTQNTGLISRIDWATIMTSVTNVKIRWLSLLSSVVPSAALVGASVDYGLFVNSLRLPSADTHSPLTPRKSETLAELLYLSRDRLEIVFRHFDSNGDGVVSRQEMILGVANLKDRLPPDSPHLEALADVSKVFTWLDLDGDDKISVNDFLESARHTTNSM